MNPQDLIKRIGDHGVLFVMAVDAEYGPHLRSRFTPLMTGVGPVEAAITLSKTLSGLKLQAGLPDAIICLGSAGSRSLDHCAVYQARSVSWRDMDASALGFQKGMTPFLDLPAELDLPLQIPGIPPARLSTGANIVSGAAYDQIDAEMVDMETYAVLRACQHFDLPLIALRGISDGKNELGHLSDWTEYLHVVDEKLAAAVDRTEAELPSLLARA